MKYLVMECHQAYAVLMDEDSRFVNAANLNYTVGQTVTDPILLNDAEPDRISIISHSVIVKVTAAAACLALICMGGFGYYSRNIATNSVVVISSGTDIEMHLNSRGQVVALESSSSSGREIIDKYNQTHKSGGDQAEVASALLQYQLQEGIISSGDTVSVFTLSGDEDNIESLITDLETDLPKLKIDKKITEKHGNGSDPVIPPSHGDDQEHFAVTTVVHQKPTANAPETTVSAVIQKPELQQKTEAAANDVQPHHTPPTTETATKPVPPERPDHEPASRSTAVPPSPPSHGTHPTPEIPADPETVTTPAITVPQIAETEPAEEIPEIEIPTELPAVTAPIVPEVQQPVPEREHHKNLPAENHLPDIVDPPLPESHDGQEVPQITEPSETEETLDESEVLP